MSIDVDDKIRQLNALRHEFSEDTANELVRGWLQEWSLADTHASHLRIERDALTHAITEFGLHIGNCDTCGDTVLHVDGGEAIFCGECIKAYG